jgi:hypothetical protein
MCTLLLSFTNTNSAYHISLGLEHSMVQEQLSHLHSAANNHMIIHQSVCNVDSISMLVFSRSEVEYT